MLVGKSYCKWLFCPWRPLCFQRQTFVEGFHWPIKICTVDWDPKRPALVCYHTDTPHTEIVDTIGLSTSSYISIASLQSIFATLMTWFLFLVRIYRECSAVLFVFNCEIHSPKCHRIHVWEHSGKGFLPSFPWLWECGKSVTVEAQAQF